MFEGLGFFQEKGKKDIKEEEIDLSEEIAEDDTFQERRRVDNLGDDKETLAYREKDFREKLERRGMPKNNVGGMADEISTETLEKLEAEKRAEKAEEESLIDALTGLANRRALEEMGRRLDKTRTRETREQKHNFSVLMFDIDHFKKVNDNFGHAAGDKVLQEVADIIKQTVRETDLIYRYGGEELTGILPETDSENALIIADKIRNNIEKSSIKIDDNREIKITISIGIFGSDQAVNDDVSFEDMRKMADTALYESKETGRNKVTIFREEERMEAA